MHRKLDTPTKQKGMIERMLYKILITALVLSTTLSWLIKLFTIQIHFSNDPTIVFAYKLQPSLVSNVILTDKTNLPELYGVIFEDENCYTGMSLYTFVVMWVWKISLLFMVVFVALYLRVNNIFRPGKLKKSKN